MSAQRNFVREISDKSRTVLEELARTERMKGNRLKHYSLITCGELAPHETRLRNRLGRLSA